MASISNAVSADHELTDIEATARMLCRLVDAFGNGKGYVPERISDVYREAILDGVGVLKRASFSTLEQAAWKTIVGRLLVMECETLEPDGQILMEQAVAVFARCLDADPDEVCLATIDALAAEGLTPEPQDLDGLGSRFREMVAALRLGEAA